MWPWVVGAAVGVSAPAAAQEASKTKGSGSEPAASKKDQAPARDEAKGQDKKEEGAEEKAGAPAGEEAGATLEVFQDENAEKALTVFGTVPGLRDRISPGEINQVKAMAANQATTDPALIERYVQAMAARLTDRSNINAVINPPEGRAPNAAINRAIPDATENLLDPLNIARKTRNTAFFDTYVRALLNTLPKLLDKNLVSRTEAMIVLGQAASPAAMPVYLAQLKDPKQTVQVKLWAVRGISGAAGDGARAGVLPAANAIAAGKAVADFLNRNEDTLWFLQLRALQALGAMRQAAVPTNPRGADMATAAMKYLANTEARFEVRAQAAWALGMLQVPPSVTGYNYPLIAYSAGKLAAEIGEQVRASFRANDVRSSYLAGLLVSQLYQAFNGVEGTRESGLLHAPGLGPAQGTVSKIASLESSVARAAVELIRAPKGQQEGLLKALGDRVAELKQYLDKNSPKDFRLVPGGPEFKAEQAQVAGAAGGRPELAGGPGGQ